MEPPQGGVGIMLKNNKESLQVTVDALNDGSAKVLRSWIQKKYGPTFNSGLGILEGDEVISIDGENVNGKGAKFCRNLIFGPQGTLVRFKVKTANEQERTIPLIRMGSPDYLEDYQAQVQIRVELENAKETIKRLQSGGGGGGGGGGEGSDRIISDLKAQISQLTSENASLKVSAERRSSSSSQPDQSRGNQDEINALKRDLESTRRERDGAKNEREAFKAELDKTLNQIDQLKQANQQLKAVKEQKSNTDNALQEEKRQLIESNIALKNKQTELEQQLETMAVMLDKLEKAVAQSQSSTDARSREYNHAMDEMKRMKEDYENALAEKELTIRSLKAPTGATDVNQLKLDLQRLQEENDRLRHESQSNLAYRAGEMRSRDDFDKEKISLQARLDELKVEYHGLQQLAKEAAEDNERLRARNADLETQVAQLNGELAATHTARTEMEEILSLGANDKESALQNQLRAVNRRLARAEAELATRSKIDDVSLSALSNQQSRDSDSISGLHQRIADLQQCLARETGAKLSAESSLVSLQATEMALEEELKKLRGEIASLKVRLVENPPDGTMRENELKLELKAAHTRIASLEQELAEKVAGIAERQTSLLTAKSEADRAVERMKTQLAQQQELLIEAERKLAERGTDAIAEIKIRELEAQVHDLHSRLAESRVETFSATAHAAVKASSSADQDVLSSPMQSSENLEWWKRKLHDKDMLISKLNSLVGSMEAEAKAVLESAKSRIRSADARYQHAMEAHEAEVRTLRAELNRTNDELDRYKSQQAIAGDMAARAYTEDLSRQLLSEMRRAGDAEAELSKARNEWRQKEDALRSQIASLRTAAGMGGGEDITSPMRGLGESTLSPSAASHSHAAESYWRQTCESKERLLARANADVSRLQEEAANLRVQVETLRSEQSKTSPELAALREQLRGAEQQQAESDAAIQRLREEGKRLHERLAALSQTAGGKADDLIAQLRDAKILIRALEQEVRGSREAGASKADTLESILKAEMAAMADLQLSKESELGEMRAQISCLEVELRLVRESERAAIAEANGSRAALQDVKSSSNLVAAQLEQYKIREAEMSRALSFLGFGLNLNAAEVRAKWEEMLDTQQALRQELERAQQEMRRLRESEAWARGRLRSIEVEWEGEKNVWEARRQSLEEELASAKDRNSTLMAKVSSMEQRLAADNDRGALLQRTIDSEEKLRHEKRRLEEELEKIKTDFISAQEALRKERLDAAESQLMNNARIASLQGQLDAREQRAVQERQALREAEKLRVQLRLMEDEKRSALLSSSAADEVNYYLGSSLSTTPAKVRDLSNSMSSPIPLHGSPGFSSPPGIVKTPYR